MSYISLDELKEQLNIEAGYNEEDAYLGLLITAAEKATENYLNGETPVLDATKPEPDIKMAMLLMCCHWYENRSTVSFAQGYKVPFAFEFLLNPYKTFTVA